MTCQELIEKLKEMFHDKQFEDMQSTVPYLFGIRYAEEIEKCEMSRAKIAQLGTGFESYGSEIGHGIASVAYVEIKKGKL